MTLVRCRTSLLRVLVLASTVALAGARAAEAGGGTVALTPGWDGFPALTSGSLEWSLGAGSATLELTYNLDGASPNAQHQVGAHHFDVVGSPNLGAGTTETGDGEPEETTREGNTSVISADEIGFLATDSNGDSSAPFSLVGVNPGVYGLQFHIRQGGAPGCPTTVCNAIFRTGNLFADELVRFSVPGAAAFWSGDGDAVDAVGTVDAVEVGAVAYRDGFFRQGFDLDGSAHLAIPAPGANGLAFASGFSVAARIVQDVLSSTASVLNLRTAANASGFTLEPQFNNPGTFLFAVNTTGVAEGFATISAAGFPTGVPIQVVASFDAASHTMRLYRDGKLVGLKTDVPGTTMALLGAEELEIGRNLTNGSKFDGLIDELLYFGRALTPDEVRAVSATIFADGFEANGSGEWSAAVP